MAGDRRPACNAQKAWRLDGTGKCRRTKDSKGRNCRSVGTVNSQPGQRLVWPQKGIEGSIWHVFATLAGSPGTCRSRTSTKKQQNARAVTAISRYYQLHL